MADEKRERRPQRRQAEDDGLIKKLIEVNRVTKVVKGGIKGVIPVLVIVSVVCILARVAESRQICLGERITP